WAHRLGQQGKLCALHHRKPPGRPSRLTPGQWQCVLTKCVPALPRYALLKAPRKSSRLTLSQVQAWIKNKFGVSYNVRYLGATLRALRGRAAPSQESELQQQQIDSAVGDRLRLLKQRVQEHEAAQGDVGTRLEQLRRSNQQCDPPVPDHQQGWTNRCNSG
ncbi:MAG: hypothetical protein M3347_06910, partial [Armatimonadota bacterium]|nr:hypothetical protein [Armatimonadota bacterium]